MAKGGMTKMAAGGGMMKKGYAAGGAMPMVEKDGKKVPAFAADGKGKMAKGGMTESKMMKKEGRGMAKAALQKHASMPASKAHKGLKSGGLAAGHKQADGIASKGKTKGMEVKMKNGGMPKTKMMRSGGRGC
jgi:hypothetical protein